MSNSHFYLPCGFRFAGTTAGIKASGKPDVSMIVADQPVVAAGVYTTNQIIAAPVILSRSRTPSRNIRAVITNSGNANACTGKQGIADASAMCDHVASLVGCDPSAVLVMSTGVIGHLLPMEKVQAGIDQAFAALEPSQSAFELAADAICTTDQNRKIESAQLTIEGQAVCIAAMAKGAGMIAPNMATMLSAVCTDAAIEEKDAERMLARVANVSFNRVSVDGHTSTNDTLLLLASGTGSPFKGDGLAQFERALTELAIDLAKQLVADGEGATHVMQLHVTGAATEKAAEIIAKVVGASPLVKTAITGGDPNWGRIVSAAGYAGEKIEPEAIALSICGHWIYQNGTPIPLDAKMLSEKMKSHVQVEIELIVGNGSGSATYWSSDLTTDYVRFNSEYTT